MSPPAAARSGRSVSLDRLAAWKQAARNRHVGTMVLKGASAEVIRVVAEAML